MNAFETVQLSNSSKQRLVVLVGYYYLTNPIYYALREQLSDFEVIYYFPKDIIGADINYASDERVDLLKNDLNYCELDYDPPWFCLRRSYWYNRSFLSKFWMWVKTVFTVSYYSRRVLNDISTLKPSAVLCTSDIFYVPRLIEEYMPNIPLFVLQPSFLDLREKSARFQSAKYLVNKVISRLFENQPYFGMECRSSNLLVWGEKTYDYYAGRRSNVFRVVNPAHKALRDEVGKLRTAGRNLILSKLKLSFERKTIVIFVDHFETLYDESFQDRYESCCIEMLKFLQRTFNVIIKTHPNGDIKYWRQLFAQDIGEAACVIRDVEKAELMAVCDIAIATNSYALVEAAIGGSVSINFFPGEEVNEVDSREGITKCYAHNAKSVESLLEFVGYLANNARLEECQRFSVAAVNHLFFPEKNTENFEKLLLSAICSGSQIKQCRDHMV